MDDEAEPARVVTTRAQTRATYDRIARYYELLEGVWERRARRLGIAALAAAPGESVLEIGCGPGHTLVALTGAVGASGRVVGLDLSLNMCRTARQRLDRHAGAAVGGVVQGDAVQLPIAAASFDAAFMSFTLELFDTPQIPLVLAECRRVLGPGGRLVMVALSRQQPAPAMQRVYEWGHLHLPRLLDCRPIDVRRALSDAGFTVAGERAVSLWGLPVAVVVGRSSPSGGRLPR